MKHFLRYALAALSLCFISLPANAATCYWVGGTGNWDSTNVASWAAASGGAASSCAATGGIPKNTVDTAVFDGSSGGGTVTICGSLSSTCPSGTGSVSITSLTFGAFTGTLDFSAINPAVTISTSFNGTGTGTRTLSMGNGVWTFGGGASPAWNFITTTGLTLNINSSSMVWQPGVTTLLFYGGGKTWGALTINANVSYPTVYYGFETGYNVSDTFASLTVNAPASLQIRGGQTQTFTGGITVIGSSSSAVVLFSSDSATNQQATIASGAVANIAYSAFRGIAGATSAINATNSVSLGGNSGTLAITFPSGGGGGSHCIGC